MGKGPFKMKGSPMQRNFGISTLRDEKNKKTVTVTDKARERGADKMRRVVKETDKLPKGDQRLANIEKEYGGNWRRVKNPKTNKSQFINEKNQTVKQAAIAQGLKHKTEREAYIAANKTIN